MGVKGRRVLLLLLLLLLPHFVPFMRFIYHTVVSWPPSLSSTPLCQLFTLLSLSTLTPPQKFHSALLSLGQIAGNRATVLHAAAQSKRLQHMSSNQQADLRSIAAPLPGPRSLSLSVIPPPLMLAITLRQPSRHMPSIKLNTYPRHVLPLFSLFPPSSLTLLHAVSAK